MTKEEKIAKFEALIKDEYEAVDGYKKFIAELDTEKDWRLIADITRIMNDELAHIDNLKCLLSVVSTDEIEPIKIYDEVY